MLSQANNQRPRVVLQSDMKQSYYSYSGVDYFPVTACPKGFYSSLPMINVLMTDTLCYLYLYGYLYNVEDQQDSLVTAFTYVIVSINTCSLSLICLFFLFYS